MISESHQLEPRSILIIKAVTEFNLSYPNRQELLAASVVEHYNASISDPEHRTIPFRDAKTAGDIKANWQLLFRMLDPSPEKKRVRLAADVEVPIVKALKEHAPEIAEKLVIKLMAQHGSYFAPIIHHTAQEEIASVGLMMNKTGELLERLAPIFADGVIDEKDSELAPQAIDSIDRLLGVLIACRQEIAAITPKEKANIVDIQSSQQR